MINPAGLTGLFFLLATLKHSSQYPPATLAILSYSLWLISGFHLKDESFPVANTRGRSIATRWENGYKGQTLGEGWGFPIFITVN